MSAQREIKFRAWDGKRMRFLDRADFVLEYNGVTEFSEFSRNDSYHRDWPLMQFTGIYDKEGQWIYEGDIVSVPQVDPKGNVTDDENYRAEVVFRYGCFGIRHIDFHPLMNWCKQSQGDYVPNYGNMVVVGPCVLKVTGNVHEK